MKAGVIIFPGSNCDRDCGDALRQLPGCSVEYIWHKSADLGNFDLIVLPGGVSYGDYLRPGAIARFSPIMQAVRAYAESGKLLIGICNGFQVLLESGLLPGAMLRNRSLKFICQQVHIRVEEIDTAFTAKYQSQEVIQMPVAHGDGCYWADESTLEKLLQNRQVLFRYCSAQGEIGPSTNPNGSLESIAGICNEARNIVGMMPHPERQADPLLGGLDGKRLFESILQQLGQNV